MVRGPRKQRDFTVLPTALLRDSRLSYRARGVAVRMLSLPDGTVTAEEIAGHGLEGRDAIRAALRELVELGYLERHRETDAGGRIRTVNRIIRP